MFNSTSSLYSVVKQVIKTGYSTLLDLVLPPFCAHCRMFFGKREIFCKACSQLISPIVSTKIPVTPTKVMKVFAIAGYKDPLRSLILAKGWSDIVAARQLGELVWDMTYLKNMEIDFFVPIPLHWSRFAKRGFNQAHEMAKVIARNSGKPVHQLLKRPKRTAFQMGLKQKMRAENLKDAFQPCCKDETRYKGKHLVLVDDLMTTGSTLKAAARQLYKLQPASVSAVVACRVV
ncbi:ComF family protein [Candidatus Dependentiae bacterium]